MTWLNNIGGIHLVNQSGTPTAGGSPYAWSTTPLATGEGWMPEVAEPKDIYRGSVPFSNVITLADQSYENVNDTIPINIVGTTSDEVADILQELKTTLAKASKRRPVMWKLQPHGATNMIYAEIYSGSVKEHVTNGQSPIEGFYDIEGEIKVTRTPFFAVQDLQVIASALAIGNGAAASSNLVSFGLLDGDLANEGQPINIQFNKPASQVAAKVTLASVVKRVATTITSTLTGVTSQTGTTFTASAAIDVSELRSYDGVALRLMARIKTITNPAKVQVMATIQTSTGNTLWIGPWVDLAANATAQLIDLRGTSLDAIRSPLTTAQTIKIQCSLRSIDGTSVTATLDYIETLLAYSDVAIIESSGLGASQHYWLFGAQNLSGGGWLPVSRPRGGIFDSSDLTIQGIGIKGTLPLARADASLYIAWQEADGGHTATDTATITINHAPLYQTLRGTT